MLHKGTRGSTDYVGCRHTDLIQSGQGFKRYLHSSITNINSLSGQLKYQSLPEPSACQFLYMPDEVHES